VLGSTSKPAAASTLPPLLDPLASPRSEPLLPPLPPELPPELPSLVPPSGVGVKTDPVLVLPHAATRAATARGSANQREEERTRPAMPH
jgi:hypothetical protein